MTFTKKAATELRERLAAKGAEGVNAMTNHSFCMNVLRRNYREAGFKQMPLIWTSEAELRAVFAEAMRCPPLPLHQGQGPIRSKKPSAEWSDYPTSLTGNFKLDFSLMTPNLPI